MKLKAKQEMFCREYLVDLNATQAAIRAGYSVKTATVIGGENLRKPYIAAFISELFAARSEKVEVSAEWVLLEAKKSYELNADTFGNDDGKDEMVNAAAAGKFLELCGKHVDVQAFVSNAKVEHTLTDDFNKLMNDAGKSE
tara:strand:- start:4094 stop:4516 length:423 start_codon:yes stop_codon:yes gene_type:complete